MGNKKEIWEEAPHIWPTKSSFFTFLRGALRRAVWERWPLKIEFKNQICGPPPEGYTGRAKSGAECALSGVWTGKSAGEIDHLVGNISLKDWEDVLPFIQHLCASKDSLQFVSKEAHRVKSYAEKMGISFDQAVTEKKIIELIKTKSDKQFLLDNNITPASNQKLRKQQLREFLMKEKENE